LEAIEIDALDPDWHEFKWQQAVARSSAVYKVIRKGRRAGGTEWGVRWARDNALKLKQDVLVISTTFGNLRGVHTPYFDAVLDPFIKSGACKPLDKKYTFYEFHKDLGGAKIILKSADSPEPLRGYGKGVGAIWLDEFAYAPNQRYLYNEILSPMALDHEILYLVTSTPAGKDLFWEFSERGRSTADKYKGWTEFKVSSRENPKNTNERIAALIDENRWTQAEVLQQVEAEFALDETSVFGDHRRAAAEYDYPIPRVPSHLYVGGVDLAQVLDATVIYILDVSTSPARIVYKVNERKLDYTVIENIIVKVADQYNATMFLDATNERSLYDRVKKRCRARPVIFSSKTKPAMVRDLAFAIERGLIEWSHHDEDLMMELSVFKAQAMETGYIKYNALRGFHDDHVAALGLAVHGAAPRLFRDGRDLAVPSLAPAWNPMDNPEARMRAVQDYYAGQFGPHNVNFSGDSPLKQAERERLGIK